MADAEGKVLTAYLPYLHFVSQEYHYFLQSQYEVEIYYFVLTRTELTSLCLFLLEYWVELTRAFILSYHRIILRAFVFLPTFWSDTINAFHCQSSASTAVLVFLHPLTCLWDRYGDLLDAIGRIYARIESQNRFGEYNTCACNGIFSRNGDFHDAQSYEIQ